MKLEDIIKLSNPEFANLAGGEVEEALQDGQRQLEELRAINRAYRERGKVHERELAELEAQYIASEDGQLFLFEEVKL
jgi:hypothetical protein